MIEHHAITIITKRPFHLSLQYIKVYGLEFTWEKLKKNKKLDLEGCQPFNATAGKNLLISCSLIPLISSI